MKNKLILKYVKPYLFSLFFTAAMSALLWITVTYGSFAFMPIAAGLCALLYAGLTLFALVNLFRGNKLFDGSSSEVFSVRTQKNIRLAGVAFALPALIYCGIFAYLVKSYGFNQSSCDTVTNFQNFEVAVFGQSKIWDFIAGANSVAPMPEPAAPEPVAQKDVDFGPFMADMQVKIKKAWYPSTSHRSKHAEVFFAVNNKGEVSKLRIERSSGSAECDRSALDAVENAAPYHAFPEGAPDSVDIKFTFDYNVFSDTPSANATDSDSVDYVGGDSFSSSSTN